MTPYLMPTYSDNESYLKILTQREGCFLCCRVSILDTLVLAQCGNIKYLVSVYILHMLYPRTASLSCRMRRGESSMSHILTTGVQIY